MVQYIIGKDQNLTQIVALKISYDNLPKQKVTKSRIISCLLFLVAVPVVFPEGTEGKGDSRFGYRVRADIRWRRVAEV